MTTGAVKVTISVPRYLAAVADEVACEKKISRSKVISLCLQDLAAERLHRKMEEGYKALAEESLGFAEQSIDLANEVLSGRE